MTALLSIRTGLGSIKRVWAMVVLFFIVNLLFSLPLALPLFHDLGESFGTSHVGQNMVEGFDYLWWEQFRYGSEGVSQTFSPSVIGKGAVLDNLENLLQMRFLSFPPALLALLAFYLLSRTFLTGGVISVLCDSPQRFSLRAFFHGAGRYFRSFFLLMLASWAFFYIVGGPLRGKFGELIANTSARSYSERPGFWLGILAGAVTLVLFLLIQMIFDYARIRTVLGPDQNPANSFLGALRFCRGRFKTTMGISYSFILLNSVLMACYIVIIEGLPQSALGGILFAFVIQELFIAIHIFLRCWLNASQVQLYQSSRV